MIEEVREAVCGECVHCDACKNMMYSCSPKSVPGSVTMDFSEMPVGKCPHFARPAAFARKSVDGEIASMKMALDERRAKYEALHDEYDKLREEHEQLLGKFKCAWEDNDRMRAQLEIVRLIFGKG